MSHHILPCINCSPQSRKNVTSEKRNSQPGHEPPVVFYTTKRVFFPRAKCYEKDLLLEHSSKQASSYLAEAFIQSDLYRLQLQSPRSNTGLSALLKGAFRTLVPAKIFNQYATPFPYAGWVENSKLAFQDQILPKWSKNASFIYLFFSTMLSFHRLWKFFFLYLGIHLLENGIILRLQDWLQHLNTFFCYHFRFVVGLKLLNAALSFNAKGHDACVIFPWLWVSGTPHWA